MKVIMMRDFTMLAYPPSVPKEILRSMSAAQDGFLCAVVDNDDVLEKTAQVLTGAQVKFWIFETGKGVRK